MIRSLAVRLCIGIAVVGSAVGLVACGPGAPPPTDGWKAPDHAVWQDAFSTQPDFLVALRPQDLSRDAVYGPLVKTSLRAAATRSTRVVSNRLLDALESCDQVIIGKYGDPDTVDGILVFVGVRADLDPGTITDDTGGVLWTRVSANSVNATSAVPEYRNGNDASLFDLGHRVWVIAAGKRRDQAREAFGHPFGRPAPFTDDGSLALLRLRGDVLVKIDPRIQDGNLAPLVKRLTVAQLSLRPGTEGTLSASFSYAEDDAAAFAEATLRDVTHAMETSKDSRPPWLKGTEVHREASVVTAKATIAEGLIDRLKKVGTSTRPGT